MKGLYNKTSNKIYIWISDCSDQIWLGHTHIADELEIPYDGEVNTETFAFQIDRDGRYVVIDRNFLLEFDVIKQLKIKPCWNGG